MTNRPIAPRGPRTLLALALCLFWSLVLAGNAAAAVERKPGSPSEDPTGRLFISPGRVEEDVEPGARTSVRITLTNDSDDQFDVSLSSTDLGQASDPRSVATQVEDGEFGAGDWLTPEVTDLRLEPFEIVEFDLRIDPPLTAPIGTNLAGLVVDSTVAEGEIGTDDSDSVFRVEGLIQVFLTVPGPVKNDLRITDIDIRDTLVLGNQRFAVWDISFQNNGTVNEHVSGNVAIKSLFGNTAHREKLENLLVLRGSKRTTRVIWRELPWIGAFTPEVRVRGDDARLKRATGERIIVLPWWVPVVLVLLIVLPAVYLWWRRRQEWKLYLEDEDPEWDPTMDELDSRSM